MFTDLNRNLFYALNGLPPFLDPISRFLSSSLVWWMGGAIALLVIIKNVRRAEIWLAVFSICLAIGLSDALSYYVLKTQLGFPRPCHALDRATLRLVADVCGSPFGLPSNHAANAMAAAVTASLWMRGRGFQWAITLLFLSALLIGLSRVLVGVHWPFDVLLGFTVGATLGSAVYVAFSFLWRRKLALK